MVRAPGFSLGGSRFESAGRHFVTLAQLVERRTFNPVVVGSSPTCDTKFCYVSVGRVAQTAGIAPYVVLRSHGFNSHTEHSDAPKHLTGTVLNI